MIQKLSGFAKFDVDAKIEWSDFARFLERMSEETSSETQEVYVNE